MSDRQSNVVRLLLADVETIPLIAILSLLGLIAGSIELFGLMMPQPALPYCVVIIAAAIGKTLWNKWKIVNQPTLPRHSGVFQPFLIDGDDRISLWPRDEIARKLTNIIDNAGLSHVIVTGPSGAGKSKLLNNIVARLFESRGQIVHSFVRYDRVMVDLLEGLKTTSAHMDKLRILKHYDDFVSAHKCSVRQVLDFVYSSAEPTGHAAAGILWSKIENYLDIYFTDSAKHLFIFDQVERLLYLFSEDSGNDADQFNGYKLYFFIKLTGYLRLSADSQTVFITRAEYLYQSLEFLENQVSTKFSAAPESATGVPTHFLCPGINGWSDPKALDAIRTDLTKIPHLEPLAGKFIEFCELESRVYSNTFLTQLVGFVLENFRNDARVQKLLIEKTKGKIQSLEFYFEHLFNDYAKSCGSRTAIATLKTVIIVVAAENRLAGQAVAMDRISALAHLPFSDVEHTCQFLRENGVIAAEFANEEMAFRLVHDIISDYALENEQFAENPSLKDGISGLSETRIPTSRLTKVANFPHPIWDWKGGGNVGLWALWGFYAYGSAMLVLPQACGLVGTLISWVPARMNCWEVGRIYLGVFIMHSIWVTFIYYVDRGYMRYTFSRRPYPRLISKFMPILGVILGVICSDSPVLFLLPVVLVGIIMGLLLLFGGGPVFVGRFRDQSREWGTFTVVNMVLCGFLMILTGLVMNMNPQSIVFWEDFGRIICRVFGNKGVIKAEEIRLNWMYFVNGVMIYFWWNIRSGQQTRTAYASMLTVFDRTKQEIVT